jgi:PAS domain S-box-containing protein
VETLGRRKDGKTFPLEISRTKWKTREDTFFTAVARDITERKGAEKRIRETGDFLKSVIECCGEGILITDEKGHILSANSAAERMYGVSKEEMIGNHTSMFSSPEESFRKEHRKRIEELLENGFLTPFESVHRAKDGGIINVESTSSMLKDGEGNYVGGISIIRDITDRKRAENEIRQTREFLENVFDTSVDGIMVADDQGRVIRVNRAMEQMLGYENDELIGKYTVELGPGDEQRMSVREPMMRRLLEEGSVSGWETDWYRKDGSLCAVEINIAILKDQDGNMSGAVAAVRNITGHKEVERDLRETSNYLNDVIESSLDCIIVGNGIGRIVKVNTACLDMLGYKEEEIVGKLVAELGPTEEGTYESTTGEPVVIGREFFDKASAMVSKLFEEGKVSNWEVYYRRKDGKLVPTEQSIVYLYDEEGKITGAVGVNRDITERKRADQEKKKLEAQLQRAQKMEAIGTLAGGVAHDLNNTLGAIVGYPDLLLNQIPEESPMRRSLCAIKQSGERAAAIVQDLLTLARRGVTATEVVNLNTVISEYLQSPEYEKLMEFHPAVEIEMNLDTDLSNIMGSPVHLTKTVANLVSNAAEAMPEGGGITVSSQAVYLDKPIAGYEMVNEGDYVVLSVSDRGVGISGHDVTRIFEPFYTKKVMGRSGTGLGMAVVWGTVKDHSGYIDVTSSEAEGTTFKLYFPITRKGRDDTNEHMSIDRYSGSGEKILVIDDAESQREIASHLLKELNYDVDVASSGEEAIDRLKQGPADLLVLDMIMDPGIDGLETYKRILRVNEGQKAIIASGFSETDRVKEAQRLGAGAYVKKPYTLEKIGLAVRAELDR